jgi:hypothetical protein
MKRLRLAVILLFVGLAALVIVNHLLIRESGHGFPIGDQIVLCEYGYSRGGDRLHWAIIRTFPIDSTPAERLADPRVGRSFYVWPLIREPGGNMVPVGWDGSIYLFDGESHRKMRVDMNEHTDTVPLEATQTLEEMWTYLQKFRVGD